MEFSLGETVLAGRSLVLKESNQMAHPAKALVRALKMTMHTLQTLIQSASSKLLLIQLKVKDQIVWARVLRLAMTVTRVPVSRCWIM
jgi:hypothetical protein